MRIQIGKNVSVFTHFLRAFVQVAADLNAVKHVMHVEFF